MNYYLLLLAFAGLVIAFTLATMGLSYAILLSAFNVYVLFPPIFVWRILLLFEELEIDPFDIIRGLE
ncbi:uncharacterized protein K452DRAFT_302040 [Aplosporella prunicola CBS 121167]|uniref:Uncharacterized protein n=1 Tax=Aplosporella prunicola CBS 121167 TaxID=1176127 RepID=A0A6A6B133_9PEZI|nr:uncharacterized protein K452DRAFT_302040 [Aplosporella prunicola CBS 121167]KAF2137278.1 hypothetical protein K452DRAFT_302040 [Aplosporella prunicola CBS 121167]